MNFKPDMDTNTCPATAPLLGYYTDGNSCPAAMTTGTTQLETVILVFHIFFTIVPILFSVAFAIVASRKIHFTSDTWRFLLDFVIIVVPIILNVTVCSKFVTIICLPLAVLTFLIFKRNNITPFVDGEKFISLGQQPIALTLLRSTVNIITAVCILAIDFQSFPKPFRKSRTYGVGLMDTGIGLFIFSMGAVSKPLKDGRDFKKLLKTIGPLLFLGLSRTVVLQAIDYQHDETEYGTHMNAFFTLGLTKLIGGLLSYITMADYHLLLLGLIILTTHEWLLQYGLAEYLMDPKVPRETFILANREGICSLSGFVGIYLISMYLKRYLYSETTLLVSEYLKKIKRLALATICAWFILFICIATVKISRRICNLGYTTWIFTIVLTIFIFYIILVDFAFHESESEQIKLPSLMDAANHNGLVFFLISNILTGCVNMFLNPDDRSAPVSILILSVYMLLSLGVVYVLLRFRIKIA